MITVVTGAAGHLGGNLVRALVALGRRVRAVDLGGWRSLDGLDVERVQADVRDLPSLERALAGAEVVYHTAAYISLSMDDWPLVEAVNVAGTRHVVAACLACGVRRLVHFSSIHALRQEPFELPVDELSPLVGARGGAPYDRSKAAGELEVRRGVERGLDAVILNPTAMIGPHDYRPSYTGGVLRAIGWGRVPVLVDSGFDWVDVRDVAEAAIRAEQGAPSGARYLLSGHWATLRGLAHLVQEITGVRPPRLYVPWRLARLAAAVCDAVARRTGRKLVLTRVAVDALRSNRRISHERATLELGYRPRPLRATVGDLFQWFEQAGMMARP